MRERTCSGCMRRAPKDELLRIARTPSGAVVIDKKQSAQGRGTYICKSEKCLEAAIKKKRIGRNLRTQIDPELYEEIKKILDDRKN